MLTAAQKEKIADEEGQMRLVRQFNKLPVNFAGIGPFPRERLEALGFTIGEEVDDIFYEVTPPSGWKLTPTDNVLKSLILDVQGNERGMVTYKEWYLDRHAFFTLVY